ncbi:hypothetical protein QAD02_017064 [Eretmocerus hayati]|uniref:Uncharacterized protein n=1 Tax=Eretmocerus hayati TaxID=131215 RepID=A0ACC2PD84_9HYME|nr:hypothetical protein QAD02_017064 [Eretmocerus hayati]
MWKFLSRGIRETIERRACRTNVYSQSSQDANGGSTSSSSGPSSTSENRSKFCPCCPRGLLVPSFSALYHNYCEKGRQIGPKDSDDHNKYDAKYTWSEAVGWSSVIAVGYVVCQSLCIRRRLFEIDNASVEKWRQRFLVKPQAQASKLFHHYILPQPNYIYAIGPDQAHQNSAKPRVSDEFINDAAEPSTSTQAYGPITAQEALQEAVDAFSSTHEAIIGELELNCGSRAIEEKRFEDAVQHFTNGSELSSVESMFNLALCYELGLGTSANYAKAVKYYKKAADKGHADAMYNLGVYHAQGKGGLKINLDAARHLFTEAAKKGHIPAVQALNLEKSFKKRSSSKQSSKFSAQCHVETKPLNNVGNDVVTELMSNNIFMSNLDNQILESSCYSYSCNPHENLSPTDIFLDMLGLHKENTIPLISVEGGP